MTEKIIILDSGSQVTQLIGRRLRELNVFCEIYPYNKIPELTPNIKGVIFSGSPFSVNAADAPIPNMEGIKGKLPLLGVCYGAQYLAKWGGGKVQQSKIREYGRANLQYIDNSNPLYLSAGNPDLTYSKEHEVTLGYMLFKGGFAGSNLHFSLTGRYIDDYIISKTMYFSKPTYLADYGYEAPAGSSFSTYDNYGSYKSLEGYLRWAQPLSEIKSGYYIYISNDYSISPYSYINMDEIRRNETRLQVNLNTDKVKNAHLELTWMLNYNQSKYKESPNTNKILSNSIEFEGNVNKILKYGFLKMKYVYNNLFL